MEEEGHSLVVVRDGRVLFSSRLSGIKSLLDALDNNVLPGSSIADKVFGRAAAMIAAQGEVTAVHTPVLSQEAVEVLADAGILYCTNQTVPCIQNSNRTGPCPIEAITASTVVPEKGVRAVRQLLIELSSCKPCAKHHQVH